MWNLGSLEAEVMDRLWAAEGPVRVRDVVDELNGSRNKPLAYTTVMSTMVKLWRKGWLRRRRSGKLYLYETTESRDVCAARIMTDVLTGSGDPETTMLHFVEHLTSSGSPELQSAVRRVLRSDP